MGTFSDFVTIFFVKCSGTFTAILRKAPGLNWEKNMRHFGLFWEFFLKCKLSNSKKTTTLKHAHDHDNFIHVYMKS